ncbi:MAG: hypothetical protein AAGE84_13585 [Cyanobacteria bacterium P01_G01_bin.39]
MKVNQILGGACIGLSIIMAFILPNRDLDTLTCSHSEQVCKYQRLSWRPEENTSIPTKNLFGAEVERRKRDDRVSYLLMLYTENDSYVVTYNGTKSRKQYLANRVNSFLEDPEDPGFSEKVQEVHIGKWIVISIIAVFGISKVQSNKAFN